jgi:hypothetical protein
LPPKGLDFAADNYAGRGMPWQPEELPP